MPPKRRPISRDQLRKFKPPGKISHPESSAVRGRSEEGARGRKRTRKDVAQQGPQAAATRGREVHALTAYDEPQDMVEVHAATVHGDTVHQDEESEHNQVLSQTESMGEAQEHSATLSHGMCRERGGRWRRRPLGSRQASRPKR